MTSRWRKTPADPISTPASEPAPASTFGPPPTVPRTSKTLNLPATVVHRIDNLAAELDLSKAEAYRMVLILGLKALDRL